MLTDQKHINFFWWCFTLKKMIDPIEDFSSVIEQSIWYNMSCVLRKPVFSYGKEIADQLQCLVTMKLINAFLDTWLVQSLYSLNLNIYHFTVNINAQPGLCQTWFKNRFCHGTTYEPHHEKKLRACAKKHTQISFTVTAKLINAFVFTTKIEKPSSS